MEKKSMAQHDWIHSTIFKTTNIRGLHFLRKKKKEVLFHKYRLSPQDLDKPPVRTEKSCTIKHELFHLAEQWCKSILMAWAVMNDSLRTPCISDMTGFQDALNRHSFPWLLAPIKIGLHWTQLIMFDIPTAWIVYLTQETDQPGPVRTVRWKISWMGEASRN